MIEWVQPTVALGVTSVADCQAACLKLPAEQQAPCMNGCIPLVSSDTAKAGVTALAAVIMAGIAGVLGLFVGWNIAHDQRDRAEEYR
jgi:hypothetical protein